MYNYGVEPIYSSKRRPVLLTILSHFIPFHFIPFHRRAHRSRTKSATLPLPAASLPSPHHRTFHFRTLLLLKSIILLLTHQPLQFPLITNLNFSKPPLPLRPLIYHPRLFSQHLVRRCDRARDGTEDVRGGFDGFDGADGVAFGDFGAGGGEFDVDYVAEGFGGVGCYADCAWGGRELVGGLGGGGWVDGCE